MLAHSLKVYEGDRETHPRAGNRLTKLGALFLGSKSDFWRQKICTAVAENGGQKSLLFVAESSQPIDVSIPLSLLMYSHVIFMLIMILGHILDTNNGILSYYQA